MRLNKISLIILSILIMTLTGCKNEPEIPTEAFDREVQTSLGNSGFYTTYESDICYIGDSQDGLIFVENKQDKVLGITIKNKETLEDITYTFNSYESSVASIYESGRYTVIIKILNPDDKLYETIDSFGIDIDSNEDKLNLAINYYINTDKCKENIDKIIEDLNNSPDKFVDALYNYLEDFEYNNDLAILLGNGTFEVYRPNLNDIIDSQSGICVDIATLGVAILRSNGIESRMVFGDYNKLYHAWIEYKDGEEWFMMDPVNKMHGLVGFYSSYVNKNYF